MQHAPVLIIDDEPDIRELLSLTLARLNLHSEQAENYSQAIHKLAEKNYSLCLTDMRLPDGDGLDIVSHINKQHTTLPVAVITAHGNMDSAIEALKRGAFDFLNKPIDLQQLKSLVEAAIGLPEQLQENQLEEKNIRLIGKSPAATELRNKIARVARSQAPIFIHGESGSGKEVCARLVHENSARCNGPFIAVNCGAIPNELVESEFFGHKKGAFTGAISDEPGLFVSANKGTLLLDEVADLPLPMQVKLLRAIQEKQIRPVGSNKEVPVDVRIISATHKNLEQLVADNLFRSDLYYRINVIDITVPPLRKRRDDIALIARQILQRIADDQGIPNHQLSDQAIEKLKDYSFPGNVRELENMLERTVALCDSKTIEATHLVFQPLREIAASPVNDKLTTHHDATANESAPLSYNPELQPLDDYLLAIEKQEIERALEHCRWNKTETARHLGMTFRSLRYRLKKLGLDD